MQQYIPEPGMVIKIEICHDGEIHVLKSRRVFGWMVSHNEHGAAITIPSLSEDMSGGTGICAVIRLYSIDEVLAVERAVNASPAFKDFNDVQDCMDEISGDYI